MKLLSVNLARSIWFGYFIDFNPKGKSLYPVIPLLINSYKFKTFPSQTDIPNFNEGIKFEEGEFRNEEGDIIGMNFTVYGDGLLAESRSSTEDTDDFLEDVMMEVSEESGLPDYEEIIKRKSYLSQLYVTTDKSLELINPKLKELSQYLSANLSHPFETGGIHIWADQMTTIKPAPFIFERAINVPFSEKRYFSSAPLPTDQHLELLNKLEKIL